MESNKDLEWATEFGGVMYWNQLLGQLKFSSEAINSMTIFNCRI